MIDCDTDDTDDAFSTPCIVYSNSFFLFPSSNWVFVPFLVGNNATIDQVISVENTVCKSG